MWRTAYALTNESNLSWSYFADNWLAYFDAVLSSGVGLFVALAVGGCLLLLRSEQGRPLGAGLGIAAAAITLVYCCYYFSGPGGASERFLLPTLALYLPPALYFLRSTLGGRQLAVVAGVLFALQVARCIPSSIEQVRRVSSGAEHRRRRSPDSSA